DRWSDPPVLLIVFRVSEDVENFTDVPFPKDPPPGERPDGRHARFPHHWQPVQPVRPHPPLTDDRPDERSVSPRHRRLSAPGRSSHPGPYGSGEDRDVAAEIQAVARPAHRRDQPTVPTQLGADAPHVHVDRALTGV